MSYTLYYHCNDCGHATLATEGEPPECVRCYELLCIQTNPLGKGNKKTTREPGNIRNGIELVEYITTQRTWKAKCLFCKELFIHDPKQFGVQLSCGCLRKSTLKRPKFLTLVENNKTVNLAECTCSECGMTARYDLSGSTPIVCRVGCTR